MNPSRRREFLADVGHGMLIACVGPALALARHAGGAAPPRGLAAGDAEPGDGGEHRRDGG